MNAKGNFFRRLFFDQVEPQVDPPNKRSSLTVYGDEKSAKKYHNLFNQAIEKAEKVEPDDLRTALLG
jgi:hypothetical protein